MTETIGSMTDLDDDERLRIAHQLIDQAKASGIDLVGPGGVLTGLTKTVLETALEEEITEHLGYDKHDPAGCNGDNSRNGTRPKTVLTEIGPVQIEVPRDRDGSFEPQTAGEAPTVPRWCRPARPVPDGERVDDR